MFLSFSRNAISPAHVTPGCACKCLCISQFRHYWWRKDLAIVFKEVVSVVNFIKSRPLHTRLFRVSCEEMGAEYNGLLFQSNIRWLSRGKVLERVANLRDKISTFLKEQKHEFVDLFSDDKWIAKLLFLAIFFSHVNQLNGSMQGKDKNILDVTESIDAFARYSSDLS